MNERAVFQNALEKEDSAQRTSYLDEACAGDADLRERIEALLGAHAREGEFLDVPAAQQLAAVASGETQAEAASGIDDAEALDFLAPSDTPGSLGRLGHYEILEIVGRGGMGVVLRAYDAQLQRVVAIKVMAAQLATNGTARKRFTREARAAAAVSHDHIVTIHAVEEAAVHPYLVMQYVSGMSLQERLERNGPLQLTEIIRIGMQTAYGLAAAHAQGLVHRDIKPANILLENGVERVKITDFGLARAAAEAHLTQSGVVAGTPQYMSPEQAEGKAIDQRTDLFSLGSVLYAMCTGRAPFRGSGTMAVLKHVCEETPRPIRETNPDIPQWLVTVIDKLHAKDPAVRYQTAAEVAELLNQHLAYLQHPSVVPLPVTRLARPPTARRRRMMAALALLSLITVVIVLAATLPRLFTPEETPIVKDSPEGKGPSSGTAAKPDPHPFIVLGGKGVAERKFDTLIEAVQTASDGDTIEIRGNGPFVIEPVEVHARILTIRAGQGVRPVIRLSPQASQAFEPMLSARGEALVLEGLEFQRLGQRSTPVGERAPVVISTRTAALHIANCRFRLAGARYSRCVDCFATVRLRNCEFLGFAYGVEGGGDAGIARVYVLKNCVQIGGVALTVSPGAEVHLTGNTLVSPDHLLMLPVHLPPAELEKTYGAGPARVEASANVLDGRVLLTFLQYPASFAGRAAPEPADTEAMLRRMLAWRDRGNLYREGSTSVNWCVESMVPKAVFPLAGKSLAEWKRFWNDPQADLSEGRIRYQGGDLLSKLAVAPEKFTPEDFRLRPDSAGYQAGKDKKDLGADVDLVGPGPAYERWKKTPEYQLWLKETAQLRATAAPVVPKLLSPAPGAVLPNGSTDRTTEYVWEFSWAAVPGATRYHLRVNAPTAQFPAIDFGALAETSYRHKSDGYTVNLKDWRWKVRAFVDGHWTGWSAERQFDVAPLVASGAFLLRGGKGVAERNFDTLADAVQAAADGDTIEVRGNGPYVTTPIKTNQALTIRAGAGFRPIIYAHPDDQGSILLQSNSILVLEGLDLVAKAKTAPELIVPEDFRLCPDSAGYLAGKAGKDLGADVDLVGPGPAYERWKKTPEYQQWLKVSGLKK